MRSQLVEFKDHRVIMVKKESDGSYFHIPISNSVLKQIVDELNSAEDGARECIIPNNEPLFCICRYRNV